jgi:TetR/AcrR family transcriptional repressor of nem operon
LSRLKKIEPQEAEQAAMLLFWEHGYHNTSTRQIEEETGLTRFSLQTYYGGKMNLFLKALDLYLDSFEEFVSPSMHDGQLETIAIWFEQRTNPAMFAQAACFGCLLLNSTVEFSADNTQVNKRAARFFAMVGSGFQSALHAAKSAGNLPKDFDCSTNAQVLLASAVSLNIVIRSAGDNRTGKPMANAAATLVRGWQV